MPTQNFYTPLQICYDTVCTHTYAPWVKDLSQVSLSDSVCVLESDLGTVEAGLYVRRGPTWLLALKLIDFSNIVMGVDALKVVVNATTTVPLTTDFVLFKNGIRQAPETPISGDAEAVWTIFNSSVVPVAITQAVATTQANAATSTTQAGIATTGASTATTQAGIATTAAETAVSARDITVAAKDVTVTASAAALVSEINAAASASASSSASVVAEAARDSINTTGKVFTAAEGTAAGIAATTNGQQFAVLSNDLLYYGIWRNDSGTALWLSDGRTKAWLDLLGFDTTYSNRSGYAKAWLDVALAMALGIRNDGRVIFGHGGDIAQRLDTSEAAITANTDALAAAPTQSDLGYSRSGFAWPWVDSQNNLSGGISSNGDLISKGINLTEQAVGNEANTAAIAELTRWITPVGHWWYGDSLSASGVGAWLASYLAKPVTVGAVGGQTAQQVAARFGGQVPTFTVTGNTIPASGAVAVTTRSIELITAQNTGSSWAGKLAGIAGTYTSDASTHWTFTRTTAGAALVIDPETPFLINISDQRMFGTVVFWYGRNNVGSPTFDTDVKKAIADSIARLQTQDRRFIVVSVLNWYSETTGSAGWTQVEAMNADLKALYPNNFVDVLNLLRRSGNGSADDIADAASGIIPRSLRNSPTDGHLNNTTGNPIVATRVFQFLNEKGWTA